MIKNYNKFVREWADILRYAFKEKCKIEDMKDLRVFWDQGMHRQMRFGVYCWTLANMEVYDIHKHWVDGKPNPNYCMGGRPIVATSVDITFSALYDEGILCNFSFESCERLADAIQYEIKNSSPKDFISEDRYNEIMGLFCEDEDENEDS